MLFDTRDNVTFVLQIIAVALSIVLVITGGLFIAYRIFIDPMLGEDYDASLGADIDSTTIVEGSADAISEFEHLEKIDGLDDNQGETGEASVSAEPIHPTELSSLKDNIKSWINTGEAVRSNDVTNILVIGMENCIDTGSTKSYDLSVNGRADAMVIVSINHATKKITLASLLRDQYCYLVITKNGKTQGSFQKLHHALAYAGPSAQIQMIERYYKIVIDNYVIVNFDSVTAIIDELGGIDVDVTQNEASFLNSSCGFNISSGMNHFNGRDALVYMRIRKGNTGGEVARTGRQRKVIANIIEQAKSYGMTKMVSVVDALIPYLRTGLTSTEILGYATTALADGWLNYELSSFSLPDDTCCKDFSNSEDGLWYWKVDFPLAAQKLQLALYGKTNIELASNRKSWI